MKCVNLAIALVLLCAGCDKAPAPADAPHSAVAPATAPVAPAEQKTYLEQKAFIKKLMSEDGSVMSACAEFQKTADFNDWTGTVSDFRTSTVNGSIDITFDMDGVLFEQVVQKTDPLYPKIEALLVGGRTRISGHFSHGNGECGYSLRTVSVNLTKADAF